MAYCSKSGHTVSNLPKKRPLDLISILKPWQQAIVDLVQTNPHKRHIHWYWEPNGNIGKTELCRLLCASYKAIICAGKAGDMKYQIAQLIQRDITPEIIIFDVPRSQISYLDWVGIEEIKNGLFASSKYESGMVCMNPPHVLIFANYEPPLHVLSTDRWCVHRIQDQLAIEDAQ
jgi:hypothetical protein